MKYRIMQTEKGYHVEVRPGKFWGWCIGWRERGKYDGSFFNVTRYEKLSDAVDAAEDYVTRENAKFTKVVEL